MKKWKVKTIEQCFRVKSGNYLPKKNMEHGDIDVYGGNGYIGKHNQYNLTGENIIIGRVGAKCGNVQKVNRNIWLTDNAFFISEFFEKFDLSFLRYLLLTKKLRKVAKHSAQPVISYQTIKNIPLVIPPISEQKQIVEILDKAFEGIDRAIANTEKNLANAREVFDSYLNNIFNQEVNHCTKKKLGDLSQINYGYTAKASQHSIGPKFLRITDIQNNKVDWDKVPYCKISEKDYAKHKLYQGDIVFARTGGTTGKSFLITDPPDAVCASYLIRLSLKDTYLMPEFLILYFQTNQYWDVINFGISGSAQGGFNATKLANLVVPIPSHSEQLHIINAVNKLSAETQRLEAIYQRKLEALQELKQSLLHKAFTGELTNSTVEEIAA